MTWEIVEIMLKLLHLTSSCCQLFRIDTEISISYILFVANSFQNYQRISIFIHIQQVERTMERCFVNIFMYIVLNIKVKFVIKQAGSYCLFIKYEIAKCSLILFCENLQHLNFPINVTESKHFDKTGCIFLF